MELEVWLPSARSSRVAAGISPGSRPTSCFCGQACTERSAARSAGTSRAGDPDEHARWLATRTSWYLDLEDLASFPGVVVYPPGAVLLEQLERARLRWKPIPAAIADRFVHHGAMSWGGAADDDGGAAPMRAEHGERVALVRERLLAYEPA